MTGMTIVKDDSIGDRHLFSEVDPWILGGQGSLLEMGTVYMEI